ncbi:aminotransferase class I/II-fold pyridoxal phosphate-dependent enzyme [Candidatus Woesearchaeota archaeon]|nr:aminotransferase class I/II-fold pyridoxal phosphate-dependent enzyme [Candidatus Woesearchaeota archaeon]
MHINDNFASIKLAIRKIAELAAQKKDCVRMDIGTPNIPTPKHIIEATKKALDEGKTAYPPYLGLPELRNAIATFESFKGVSYKKENVIVTAGAAHALFLAIAGICKPGEKIFVLKPYWEYDSMTKGCNAEMIGVNVEELLQKKPDSKTKAILINSPNNPSGKIYSEKTLKDIAEFAIKNNLFIITDEVYDHIYFGGKPHSIAKYAHENTLIVNSVSKTYSMTGYRVGWLCGPAQYMDALGKGIRATVSCCNTFAQYGALAALNGNQQCVEEQRKIYAKRKEVMEKRIKKIGWECDIPEGAFYFYPKITVDSWQFTMDLLEKANVAVVPGETFGNKDHIRLCFASLDEKQINEGFDRIEKYLK